MECITIYKKDLKYYMFVLYVIHNFRHKGINVVFNEVVADDLRDIISPTGTHMAVVSLACGPPEELEVSENLYVSNGLSEYVKYFKDEKLSLLEKQNTWLLCSADDSIIWIIGMRKDNRFKIETKTSKTYLKITFLQ